MRAPIQQHCILSRHQTNVCVGRCGNDLHDIWRKSNRGARRNAFPSEQAIAVDLAKGPFVCARTERDNFECQRPDHPLGRNHSASFDWAVRRSGYGLGFDFRIRWPSVLVQLDSCIRSRRWRYETSKCDASGLGGNSESGARIIYCAFGFAGENQDYVCTHRSQFPRSGSV